MRRSAGKPSCPVARQKSRRREKEANLVRVGRKCLEQECEMALEKSTPLLVLLLLEQLDFLL
jgi:hypothetical protein